MASDLDFELESYFHQQMAGELKKYEKKSEPKIKQIKTMDKAEKKADKELTPKEEREMLQAIADEIEDSLDEEIGENADHDDDDVPLVPNEIHEPNPNIKNKILRPDFIDAYPPMDIEPFKHKKTEKIKTPPPNSPGNMGTDKDWHIPAKFANNGDYGQYRMFDYLIEPKNMKPHSTFLLIVQSSTEGTGGNAVL